MRNNAVGPRDALEMIKMTPTQRLEWLIGQHDLRRARDTVVKLLEQYERFLETVNVPKGELVELFLDKPKARTLMIAANKFGDLTFQALTEIGDGNAFYRMLVV